MQNEFEKQVRHKMEELNLVPSEPVWEKIEEQIRKKKDRRRIILWLPLLCLFLAGGIWWMNSASDDPVIAGKENSNTKQQTSKTKDHSLQAVPNPSTTGNEPLPENNRSITREAPVTLEQEPKSSEEKTIHSAGKNRGDLPSMIDRQLPNAGENTLTGRVNRKKQVGKNNSKDVERQQPFADNYKITPVPSGNKLKPVAVVKDSIQAIIPVDTLKAVVANESTRAEEAALTKKEELLVAAEQKKDSLATSAAAKPKPHRVPKWKFGMSAAVGVAGISNGLNLFGGQKSMADATPVAMPSTGMYFFDASPEQNRNYFSLGAVVTRSLSRKVSLSTGIGYHQFNTTIVVGKRLDSTLRTGLYSNQFANMGIGMQDYINRFHFISLPFGLEVRILKKLNLHGDLMVQQLVASNALSFDFSSQRYYHDIDNYKKTQLSGLFGLEYALLDKKQTLLVGPQLQYSFSRLEQEDLNKRLFSYGLRARLLFPKK